MPTISVVIPLYNHEKYIHAAVESVLGQDLRPSEIIIVNDGSRDGSERIMADILHHHPDIVFWSQPNQGAYQAISAPEAVRAGVGRLNKYLSSDHSHRFHGFRRSQSQKPLVRTEQIFL